MNRIQTFAASYLLVAGAALAVIVGCEAKQPTTSLDLPLTRAQAAALAEKDYGVIVAPGLKGIRVDGTEYVDTSGVRFDMIIIGDVTEDGMVEIQLYQFVGRDGESVCCFRSISEAEGGSDRYWQQR